MLKEFIEAHKQEIMSTWEDLHKIPELGREEVKTSAYLKDVLAKHGIAAQAITPTGFIAEVDSGKPGITVGLRADMDALPYKDEQGKPYCVHACGHDAHMTMGLWTLIALKELGLVKSGKVRGLFQPSEEKDNGAMDMVEGGAAKGLDELYGVHIRPIQELRYGQACPALLHGARYEAKITVHGKESHGARPHLGANAIDAAALIIMAINAIWLNPVESWSCKAVKITGGSLATNIIPNEAEIILDIRCGTNPLVDELLSRLDTAVKGAAASVGCTAEFTTTSGGPAADYDAGCVEELRKAIVAVIGEENTRGPIVTSGSDDFHFYRYELPSLKTAFLALGTDAAPGLHDPKMTFNHDAMYTGIEILTTCLAGRTK